MKRITAALSLTQWPIRFPLSAKKQIISGDAVSGDVRRTVALLPLATFLRSLPANGQTKQYIHRTAMLIVLVYEFMLKNFPASVF